MSPALADLSSPEVGAASAALLVVPLGSTEQHGPHLPLSTDTDIATALARALVKREHAALAAPPIAYGACGEHAGFPGTISIGAAATELLLVELVRSATDAFPQVLLICAHGGNGEAVDGAIAILRSEGRNVRAFFPRWRGDAHAGRVETSLMLALRPGAVHLERAAAGNVDALASLMPRLVQEGVRAVSANGVLGDPAGASAREGEELLAAAVREASKMLASWRQEPRMRAGGSDRERRQRARAGSSDHETAAASSSRRPSR